MIKNAFSENINEKKIFFHISAVCMWAYVLPSPCTASFQALSVNAFQWLIRDERPGDA